MKQVVRRLDSLVEVLQRLGYRMTSGLADILLLSSKNNFVCVCVYYL